MSKREASSLAPQGIDIDAPRAKRHKPGPGSQASPPRKGKEAQQQDKDVAMEDGEPKAEANGADGAEREAVKEKGMKLWQVVKDAVNKEGRILSNDFLRLPSKRQYPDYYQLIKAPISLDEIKTQLEKTNYATFDDVRQDFERCFKNAKRYNMKDSQIWKDAKHLHKVVTKEAAALSGTEVPAGDGDDADEHPSAHVPGASSDVEEGGDKHKKKPNMNRLLKARLEKLVNFTDQSGRTRSVEFMELPNKKKWPVYYKTIKKPQCLENIFKKIKRKEYGAPVDFANDVELVFSNAMEFNQEHSEVWEDAIALRDYFRQLMADLPAPFTIAAYATSDHSTKIKLKKPKPDGTLAAIPVANTTTPGTLLLRVPGQHMASAQASTSASPLPATKLAKASKAAASSKSKQGPATPASTNSGMGALQPAKFVQPTASYQLNTGYAPNRAAANALPNTNSIHPYMKPTAQAQATSGTSKTAHLQNHINPTPVATPTLTPAPIPTPTPVYRPPIAPLQLATANVTSLRTPTPTTPTNTRQLRSVSLRIKPSERHMELDHKHGVRIWALRLSHADTSIYISDVKFLSNAEEEEESDDDAEVEVHEEEEEEEENGENEPEKPSKRTRGRPKRGAKAKGKDVKGKGKALAPAKRSHEEIQVKLNGITVKGMSAAGKKGMGWTVALGTGSNLVEVGEKDGSGWKFYLERPAAP